MTIISEYYSTDGTRKAQILRRENVKEPYVVKIWIGDLEQKQHEKSFAYINIAEWYAEDRTQK